MRDDRDEFIDRVVDELKALPPVPADAAARVLARLDAARRSRRAGASVDGTDDDVIGFPAASDEMQAAPPPARPVPAVASSPETGTAAGFHRRLVVSFPAAIGYALAATLAGFLIRGAMPRSDISSMAADRAALRADNTAPSAAVPAITRVANVVNRAAEETPVPTQFVLDAPRAASVALVGDFNGWDRGATPLGRDSASGVWTAVVQVRPGRHVYAFLVDGKAWTLDPRAPRVKDPDYGSEQSVMIVGVQ